MDQPLWGSPSSSSKSYRRYTVGILALPGDSSSSDRYFPVQNHLLPASSSYSMGNKSQSEATFGQPEMASRGHTYPSSHNQSTQWHHSSRIPANSTSYSHTHPQPAITRPSITSRGTGTMGASGYKHFLRSGLNTSGISVEPHIVSSQNSSSLPLPNYIMATNNSNYSNHNTHTSTQEIMHVSVTGSSIHNTQHMEEKNGNGYGNRNRHASNHVSYTEDRFMPAVTKPSKARNRAPGYMTELLATLKQYLIDTSQPRTTSRMAPKPMAATPQAQPTVATKRTTSSAESAAEESRPRKRKGQGCDSMHTSSQSIRQSNGNPPATQLGHLLQRGPRAVTNNNATHAPYAPYAPNQKQSSTTNTSRTQLQTQNPVLGATLNHNKADTNDSVETTGHDASGPVVERDTAVFAHVKPTTTITTPVHPHIAIVEGLQCMIRLANGVKHKTMPREEAFKLMGDLLSIVQLSICH